MLLLPALIVAYYMLYLIKSHALAGRWAILRGPVTIVAFGCFFYTAWAWTENHVLSLHEEVWKSSLYIRKIISIATPRSHRVSATGSRRHLRHWRSPWPGSFTGAGGSTIRSTLISRPGGCARWRSWVWRCRPPRPGSGCSGSRRRPEPRCSRSWPFLTAWRPWRGWRSRPAAGCRSRTRRQSHERSSRDHFGRQRHDDRRRPRGPRGRRLAAVEITSLFDAHRQAAQVGGMGVFLVFFAVNAAVIAACVLIVKRALRPRRLKPGPRSLFAIFSGHRRKTC